MPLPKLNGPVASGSNTRAPSLARTRSQASAGVIDLDSDSSFERALGAAADAAGPSTRKRPRRNSTTPIVLDDSDDDTMSIRGRGRTTRSSRALGPTSSSGDVIVVGTSSAPVPSGSGSRKGKERERSSPRKQFVSPVKTNGPPIASTSKVISPPEIDLEDELSCEICYELLINPLLLNCDHTFCATCVLPWLDAHDQECPTCRQKTTGPPIRARHLERIIEKVWQGKLKKLEAEGQLAEATKQRAERNTALKAAEAARIAAEKAKARPPPPAPAPAMPPLNVAAFYNAGRGGRGGRGRGGIAARGAGARGRGGHHHAPPAPPAHHPHHLAQIQALSGRGTFDGMSPEDIEAIMAAFN